MRLLGIDVGTGGTRAVVVDERGGVLASATAEHAPFASPQTGWAEQDPRDWWRATAEAVRGTLARAEVSAEEIACVGFSGQMHGAVLLDGEGSVLRPALIWCDQRTDAQCRSITERVGAARLIELTSNPALTNFTLTKMLWVREHEPELWARVRTVLLPKDYVRFRLTGERATDVADASGTLLFDVARRAWSREMLDAAEIEEGLLPRVFESPEVTGRVTAEGAAATSLREGTPVVAGAGDEAAGAVGMGVVRRGGGRAVGGDASHTTGGETRVENRDPYDLLCEEASVAPAGSDGVLWAPYLMGERTPHLDPHARAALVGLAASHARAHVVRAILEGVAFSLRDTLTIFDEMRVPVETIRLGGGGARAHRWRPIQADVYGRAVEVL